MTGEKYRFVTLEKGKNLLSDFEHMRDMAELKALSKHSLEKPLTSEQADRMIFLGRKLGFPV